jgi:ATP-dependent Clp protease ATP-binding subunit ClpA
MDNIIIDKVFPNLDKKLLKIVQNRINSFQESLQKGDLQIDLHPDLQSDLIKVFLFSEFIASNLTRSPDIFNNHTLHKHMQLNLKNRFAKIWIQLPLKKSFYITSYMKI